MFDLTNEASYTNAKKWVDAIRRVVDIPIVLCGNKADMEDLEVDIGTSSRNLRMFCAMDLLAYYSISVKNNYNITKPLTELAKAMGAQVKPEYQ